MKKFLKGFRFFITVFVVVCSLFAVACNETDDPAGQNGKQPQIILSQSELTIENYESAFLRATLKNVSGDVVWASSAPAVATVDENGKVSALSIGETTVTASVGDTTGACKVFVVEPTAEPTLTANYEEIAVKETGNFTLSFRVFWGGDDITEQAEFSYRSGNTSVATVAPSANNDGCTVTGVNAGKTAIVAKATVRGKTAYKEIPVTVKQEEVSFNAVNADFGVTADGYTVDVATVAVDEHVNAAALEFYATYRGQRIDNLSIAWTTEDSDVVQVDGNEITSLKAGKAVVLGEYYYQPLDTTYTIKVLVNVYKPQFQLSDCYLALNKEDAKVSLPTQETSAKMTVGEQTKTVEIQNGKALLDTDVAFLKRNVKNDVTIETDLYVFTFGVSLDDYVIESKEDFIAWYKTDYFVTIGESLRYCDGQSVVLNADVDLAGETFNHTTATPYAAWEDGLFYGTFDGKNHVISNFTGDVGFLPQVGTTGVVKNLSMVNTTNTGTKGFLGQCFLGEMENCYFQGKQTAISETRYFTSTYSRWVIQSTDKGHNGKAKSMKNVVVNVERASGETVDVMSDDTPYNVVVENVFVVSNKNNGKRFNDTTWTSLRSLYTYVSLADMQADVTKLPTGCDESVWVLKNGTLATKSAVEYFDEYYAAVLDGVSDLEELFVGVGVKFSTEFIEWSFNLQDNSYTFVDGTLTVTDETYIGQDFTVTAKIRSKDGTYVNEKTVTVRRVSPLPTMKTLKDVFVGLNKADGAKITIEETGYETRVFVDGAEKTAVVSVNGAQIDIPKTCLGAAGVKAVEVRLLQNGSTAYVYTGNVEVFDYTLATKAEFIAWYKPGSADSPNAQYQNAAVALTADIDLAGESINQAGAYGIPFKGTFDGKGHVISNFEGNYGLIPYLTGTLKNLAMVNMTVKTKTAGFLGIYFCGTLENCYFQGTHLGGENANSNRQTGLYSAYTNATSAASVTDVADKISNVVVDVYKQEVATETNALYGFGVQPNVGAVTNVGTTTIKNMYMVYNGMNDNTTNGGLTQMTGPFFQNNHFYKTLAALKAEVTKLPSEFDGNVWAYHENYGIIMRSALAYKQAQNN